MAIGVSSAVTTTAATRLRKDYQRLMRDPVPFITAHPAPSNILEWHYVITGPPDTPYHDGLYHGKLVFPPDYPFKPPSIYMLTPNGRFKPNTRLCLSMSDFHPDTWNPSWQVATILQGLLSFMVENGAAYGTITSSEQEQIRGELDTATAAKNSQKAGSEAYLKEETERARLARQAAINNRNNWGWAPNLLILVGVATMAYVVRYVYNSVS